MYKLCKKENVTFLASCGRDEVKNAFDRINNESVKYFPLLSSENFVNSPNI